MENERLAKENAIMRAQMKREMSRITSALKSFKNAVDESNKMKLKYEQLQQDLNNCKQSLHTSISITKYSLQL